MSLPKKPPSPLRPTGILEAAELTAQIHGRTGKIKRKEDFVLKIIPHLQTASDLG